ncbi:energy transducer TonB [Novosphingobium sp. BL-52-GroH]|uniref:energy transducer TonB n=1 Tax=Novosphingobium sp. BL-52-GroH TaxID=3349877 RepID=UPI00384EF9C0
MSYTDGNSGNRNKKVLTGGVVALIQGGLAIALVNGFAVTFLAADPPRHLPSNLYPTAPIPSQPVETPRIEPERPLQADPVARVSQPRLPAMPDTTLAVVPVGPVLPTGGVATGEPFFVTPTATETPARFTPKVARPRGDVARWVTTDDYPTADIRAGHTGTVRFRLGIDASGRVTDCTVTQSSGHAGLDAATCRNVTRRARFDSASDGAGEKVAGTYDGTIRWVIPQD